MTNYKNKKINVVYDQDLKGFLEKIGAYDDIINGNKKCKYTKNKITMDNIYSIFEQNGEVKIVSEKPEAIEQFLEFLHNKK